MGRGGEAGLGLSDFASGTLDSSIVAEGLSGFDDDDDDGGHGSCRPARQEETTVAKKLTDCELADRWLLAVYELEE